MCNKYKLISRLFFLMFNIILIILNNIVVFYCICIFYFYLICTVYIKNIYNIVFYSMQIYLNIQFLLSHINQISFPCH